jgi:hypothetical protein
MELQEDAMRCGERGRRDLLRINAARRNEVLQAGG